jgi:hypothetical protein
MASSQERPSDAVPNGGFSDRAFRWFSDKLAGSTISFFVALGLGAVLGAGAAQITNNITNYNGGGGVRSVRADDWQDHRSAWTVILALRSTRGQAEAAVEYARRIPTRGMSLGVLDSNDYNLEPNYWVAFIGQFDTPREAETCEPPLRESLQPSLSPVYRGEEAGKLGLSLALPEPRRAAAASNVAALCATPGSPPR